VFVEANCKWVWENFVGCVGFVIIFGKKKRIRLKIGSIPVKGLQG
jgi:hypothetical protein